MTFLGCIEHTFNKWTQKKKLKKKLDICGIWSRDLWIWRLTLYQLSYAGQACRAKVRCCIYMMKKKPRIEPVGKPYREVCPQTKLWPRNVHQPSSWSKRPGTWILYVWAYYRDERKYEGCIELLFKLYVLFADCSTDHIFCYVSL